MGGVTRRLGVTLNSVEEAAQTKAGHSAEKIQRQSNLVVQSGRGWQRVGREGEMCWDKVERNEESSDHHADEVGVYVNRLIVQICRQPEPDGRRAQLTSERAAKTRSDRRQLPAVAAEDVVVVRLPWHLFEAFRV